jgi:hypothetical protein
VERRIRRGEAAERIGATAVNHANDRFVQLTISATDAQHAARAA